MTSLSELKSASKNEDSAYSSEDGIIQQEHARPRVKPMDPVTSPRGSTSDITTSVSQTSLSSSISRFRTDFEDLKCKMIIFGESLNLCRCIASDFKHKLSTMEKRLQNLEKRQNCLRSESNYSAIIQKNKKLSTKTLHEAKKLQMCGTEEEMREVAGRICRNYLHGAWKTVDPSELVFRRISGGLSNFLYYVALPEETSKVYSIRDVSSDADPDSTAVMSKDIVQSTSFNIEEPKKVLLRIYGQVHGERAMDAIVTESVIFTLLSERRLGPKLHGVFSGGRIEEYILARPLLMKELAEPSLSMKIAEKMAAIHSMDVPLAKEPNWIWKTMGKWMKTVRDERLAGNAKGKNEEEQSVIKQLKTVDFEKEIEWLKMFLATVDSPVVFCHNDMQGGNILMLEDPVLIANDDEVSDVYVQTFSNHTEPPGKEFNHNKRETFEPLSSYEDANTSDSMLSRISDIGEPKLVLIDFEYCSYNYRGFDIANHFQEWGYDYTNPDYPFYTEKIEHCPNLEQKEIFIKEYLKHYHCIIDDKSNECLSLDAVNKLLTEVDAFALASHLFWGLWSIVNASKSQIPFGYWEYGLSRVETYLRLKQEVIKKNNYGLPQKRKICEVDI